MMDFLQLDHNPFLAGGLVLMILGGALFYLKKLPRLLRDLIDRFFILRIEIQDDDEAYQWMQIWLADKLHKTLSLSVITKRGRPGDVEDVDLAIGQGNKPAIYFVPAVGTYFFRYQGRLVTLYRDRQENTSSAPMPGGGNPMNLLRSKESFTIRIFTRQRDLARRLLQECRDKALPDNDKLDILVSTHSYWSVSNRVRPRPLSSVILDGGQADELLADMKEFLAAGDWYRQVGVPYRRGYLLYGPPGNGKTSVVKALAGELGLSIYLLMLNDVHLTDGSVNDLLARVPERSIVLLEDIDCALARRRQAGGKESGLTFSGLLNALDGVASSEGRIIVMTTNHLDKLDPALIRPGRADVKLWFGNATADQAQRLFERFFPGHGDLARDFAGRVTDRHCSMATLQDYLMLHRHSPEAALQRVHEIARLQTTEAVAEHCTHALAGHATRP
jgi:chaperone BCS1